MSPGPPHEDPDAPATDDGDSTGDEDESSNDGRNWRRAFVRAATVLSSVLVGLGRFLFVTGRLLVVVLVLAGTVVADDGVRARVRRWFLLDGDRWLIAGGITVATFAGTFVLVTTNLLGSQQGTFVSGMFSAVISGLFSFVPIVVSVNQLTASRVVGSLSDIREQMESAREFQRQVAAMNADKEVAASNPSAFLAAVTSLLRSRATALREAVADQPDPVRSEVEAYVDVVLRQAEHVGAVLDGSRRPLNELLVPMMGDNYPQNVQDARRLETEYGDRLSERARALLEALRELSVTLDLLRQYYKAMYIQGALSRLSRWIGYTGVGAFFVAIVVVMGFAEGQPFPGWPLLLDLSVSAAVAAVVLPFAVLLSIVIRIATITERTAAPGPFTPLGETPSYARHRDD